MTASARTASTRSDYERLGLRTGEVAAWEDGFRTGGRRGTYEWWYFDAHLDDGTALVIVFYTKESLATWTGLRPSVSIELDRPGEPKRSWIVRSSASDFSSSTATCDVRIAGCTFSGSAGEYAIHVETDDLRIDLTLTADVPAWRPETGHFIFGERRPRLFAWLPAVPQGRVRGNILDRGTTQEISGVGYHDHNWGDTSMMRLMNHWYWGRAQAGPYSVIASWLIGAKRYGYDEIPIFMLAKDGRIIADDAQRVRLLVHDQQLDDVSGLPVPNRIIYEYTGDEETYRVTFQRTKTILRTLPRDVDSRLLRAFVAIARIRGGYLRFTGTVTVERIAGGVVLESEQDAGIWEITYFAQPPRGHWSLPRSRS